MPKISSVVVSLVALTMGASLVSGCASPSSARSAGNLGTNVCITNSSSRPISVDFTRADTTRGAGQVVGGATACGEGTFFIGNDVEGVINWGGQDDMSFAATNPWMGAPIFVIRDIDKNSDSYLRGICTGSGWDEGESHVVAVPSLKVEATRKPDNGWKQFAVTFSDGNGSSQGDTCARSDTREHV